MKLVDFCMSCYFVGAALMLFSSFNGGLNSSAGVMNVEGNMMASGTTISNLMEKKHHSSFHGNSHQGDVSLEDYRPFDPSPSSKAVKPKPIQHGTPLMPYIPNPTPSPPMPSNNDAFP